MQNSLLQLFPINRRAFWSATVAEQKHIQEIRLRCNKPIIILIDGKEKYLNMNGSFTDHAAIAYRAESGEMDDLVNHICHYSLYAFADEIRRGFITVQGGHRVGIAGQVVLENDGSVRTIKNITCINIRVSHQICGVADKVLPHIYDSGMLKNVLIISPPGCGKTTLLRDMVRQISDGNIYGKGMCVGVVDERSEIAGSYQGIPQNDIGMRTDVLDACPKALGMMLLLRSMSPQVIAIDELGGEEDMHALHMAAACGSRVIVTVHGADVEDVIRRFGENDCGLKQMFDCYVILARKEGRPVVKEIINREEAYAAIYGRRYDNSRVLRTWNVVSPAICAETTNVACITEHSGDVDG